MHPDSLLDISNLRKLSLASNTWATIMAILRSESRQGVHELQGVESLMWLDSEFHMMTFGETFVPFEMGIFYVSSVSASGACKTVMDALTF